MLNGDKRWITNGGIAQVLTVMARTSVENGDRTKVSAFVVTPDMCGFEVVETRMAKCSVRGTATRRLAFRDMRDMYVPSDHVLGKLGHELRIALTVLDYGRTIGSFELVKQKLAAMAAGTFAMESCTFQTAALVDSGNEDFMLETAMLKVFSTEQLWIIINDTIQIHGGMAYFCDQPFERLVRGARINMIGESANDVLRAFIALVGMRDVGLEMESLQKAIMHPLGNLGRLGGVIGRQIESLIVTPG